MNTLINQLNENNNKSSKLNLKCLYIILITENGINNKKNNKTTTTVNNYYSTDI